jgi:hypothetical protein
MPANTLAASTHAAALASYKAQLATDPLTPGGTVTVQWGNSTLNAQVNLTGLAANTSTQGFVVPGTCANPGGIATFRTKAVTSDANGNVPGSGTRVGMLCSGIRLPKAVEVVQNGQIVLCGDTTQDSSL